MVDGVSLENPPNEDMFKPEHARQAAEDLQLIRGRTASRAARAEAKTTVPEVHIHNHYAGSDSSSTNLPTSASTIAARAAPASAAASLPGIAVTLRPKISLKAWAETYDIDEGICSKLAEIGVKGPHALAYLSKEDLSDAGLRAGEVAEVRDGEVRWKSETSA
jgi:hypothetical protein